MKTIRVLLIDDSGEFLEAVEYFLKRDPRCESVGWAAAGKDGQVDAEKLKPDLVLMDLMMPAAIGSDLIRKIKNLPHAPRVIVMTHYDYAEYRVAAKHAGADGFIGKHEIGTRLLSMIQELFPEKDPNEK